VVGWRSCDVPTLVLDGDDDQIVPIQSAALRSVDLRQNGTFKVYAGAPHGLNGAFEQEFNHDLMDYIGSEPPL
jgi:non-heme chloroperoxidase